MRKMYSEEQVRAIAETAVVNALAAIGVEPNEFNGIDVDGLLTAGDSACNSLVVGGNSANLIEGSAVIKNDLYVENTTELGWDPKEAMSNFMANQGTVRIGGVMSTTAVFNGEGIRFDVDSSDNQYIIFSTLPTTDPQIPGALWYDNQTFNVKISSGK